jgi:hypothetical protein
MNGLGCQMIHIKWKCFRKKKMSVSHFGPYQCRVLYMKLKSNFIVGKRVAHHVKHGGPTVFFPQAKNSFPVGPKGQPPCSSSSASV